MMSEGDIQKADYILDTTIGEYYYRMDRHNNYVKQRNAAMKTPRQS
jgi:hypothetical protein